MANSAKCSIEANWSGSTLFAKTGHVVFSKRRVNILIRRCDINFNKVCLFFSVSVIQSLVALVNDPEPEHPLRADLAEEYTKDKKKFNKNAEDFTKKHSEKRPSD